jgi:hypothetical protein
VFIALNAIRQEIYLADFVRILRILHIFKPHKEVLQLKPDDEILRHVYSLLGLELTEKITKKTQKSFSKAERPHKFLWNDKPHLSDQSKSIAETEYSLSMRVIEENLPIKIPIPEMPEPLKDHPEDDETSLKHYPLLNPIWARAIITKLLSTEAYGEIPDTKPLIIRISKNQPIRKIPYKSLPTLRRGVQVLIDVGPGLEPYIRDQVSLLEQLIYIMGSDRVEAWNFIGTPLKRAISYSEPALNDYVSPIPGTPILLLTDFGIVFPPSEAEIALSNEWKSFVEYVHDSGCPVFALTPYGSNRWPKDLMDQIKIVQWDRGTTILTLLKSIDNS